MIFRILAFTAFWAATTLAFYEAPDDCDWDFIDEDGEDIFDRVGLMIFGGSGWVSSLYRNVLGPSMSSSRRVYRKYLSGFVNYVATILFAGLMYELIINRRVHLTI